jgi:hypothetical protein
MLQQTACDFEHPNGTLSTTCLVPNIVRRAARGFRWQETSTLAVDRHSADGREWPVNGQQ